MKTSRAKDACVIPFHGVYTANLASNTANIQISPTGLASVLPRVTAEADGWQHFRVRSLRWQLHRVAGVGGTYTLAAFIGSIPDTAPASLSQASEILNCVTLATVSTVPSRVGRANKSELAGCFPWYKSINGGADVTEEAPGNLVVYGGATTDPFIIEIWVTMEFKTGASTGQSPVEKSLRAELLRLRKDAAVAVERRNLLTVLGSNTARSIGQGPV